MDNFVSLLQHRADRNGQKIAYTFLNESGLLLEEVNYSQLDYHARKWAVCLQQRHKPGERVLLLFPSGPLFLIAFLACLYAGLIAVPSYPPARTQRARSFQRFMAVANNSMARVGLVSGQSVNIGDLQSHGPLLNESIDWIDVDEIDSDPDAWTEPEINLQDIAFLQYTSGSTAAPKGVIVTHGNIMHNQNMIQIGFNHSADDIVVGWLPLFHDMGLIGNLLQPLYLGAYCVLMPPACFLSSPYKWLSAISKYKATTSGGPDFSYRLCVEKIKNEDKKLLDLSSWRVAFNGSEPVRASTIEKFSSTFETCGFNRQAFLPCYGLAETTLLATIRNKHQPLAPKEFSIHALQADQAAAPISDADAITLVSSGHSPQASQSVIVVSVKKFMPCEDKQVGEIWIKSDSVAQGYWQHDDVDCFEAYLADYSSGPFLRTGDLGFMLDGELFVTGRLKDLIILNGRNLYPNDIEHTVENCHPALCSGSSAAFSVQLNSSGSADIGKESLIIVSEISNYKDLDLTMLMELMNVAVLKSFNVKPEQIVLIRRRSLPKTTSGKVQRSATKLAFLNGELRVVQSYRPANDQQIEHLNATTQIKERSHFADENSLLLEKLHKLIADKLSLPIEKVDIKKSPVALGMDSLVCASLRADVISAFNVDIGLEVFLDDLSIVGLGKEIMLRRNDENYSAIKQPHANHSNDQTPVPLSFAQLGIWLADQLNTENIAFNLPFAIDLQGQLNLSNFRQAISTVVARHSIFNTVLVEHQGKPLQLRNLNKHADVTLIDLSALDESIRNNWLKHYCLLDSMRSFDLSQGPLYRFLVFRITASRHVLYINLHHIIADGWSIGLVLKELTEIYGSLSQNKQPKLKKLPYQYIDYALWQRQAETTGQWSGALEFWKKRLSPAPAQLDLSSFSINSESRPLQGGTFEAVIAEKICVSLRQMSQQENLTIYILLLTILKVLLYRRTGEKDITVGTGTLGRNIADSEKIVGNFINMIAMRTDCSGNPKFKELMKRVKETCLSAFAHQDIPFELLASKVNIRQTSMDSSQFQVTFGTQNEPRVDAVFEGLTASRYPLCSAPVSRYDLSLWVSDVGQNLKASWTYNAQLFDRTAIKTIHQEFELLSQAVITNPDTRLNNLRLRIAPETDNTAVETASLGAAPQFDRSKRKAVTVTAAETEGKFHNHGLLRK